jgi:hypothetical protein
VVLIVVTRWFRGDGVEVLEDLASRFLVHDELLLFHGLIKIGGRVIKDPPLRTNRHLLHLDDGDRFLCDDLILHGVHLV